VRVSLLAVLLVIASAPALAADKPELRYEGKPLADWVTRFQKADTREQRTAAANAILAFGADAAPAVPALIEMLSDLSPTFRYEVIDLLGALGPIAKDARPAILKLRREKKILFVPGAVTGFVAVFPNSKDAVPDLIPYLNDTDDDVYVYSALCNMGPAAKDAIPAIRQYVLKKLAAKETGKDTTTSGLYSLSELGPDAVPLLIEMLDVHGGYGRMVAIGCLEELGPKAIKAAPALVKLLKHDDAETRYRAAKVLWKLDKNPAVVPALVGLLAAEANIVDDIPAWRHSKDLKSNFAADAAKMLGEIGPDAKEALPALRKVVAIGIPASVLCGAYQSLGAHSTDEEYKQILRLCALVAVAEAAAEAINKIEGRPKK
jgi:HEAT repeat protein